MNTSSHQLVLTDFLVFILLHVLIVCCEGVCVCVFFFHFVLSTFVVHKRDYNSVQHASNKVQSDKLAT